MPHAVFVFLSRGSQRFFGMITFFYFLFFSLLGVTGSGAGPILVEGVLEQGEFFTQPG